MQYKRLELFGVYLRLYVKRSTSTPFAYLHFYAVVNFLTVADFHELSLVALAYVTRPD